MLEDEPVERELVPAAGVRARRPDAAQGEAADEREPELGGLEPRAGRRPGPLEQGAAQVRRRELGEGQDGDADAERGAREKEETEEPARTRRHRLSAYRSGLGATLGAVAQVTRRRGKRTP